MVYNYCHLTNYTNNNLTCNKDLLVKIDAYYLRNDQMHIQIYQCSCCNGLWKRTTFNEIDKWLEVGEVTVAQENYIPFDQYGYYPIEYFTTDEAYYYDNTIYCGNPQETKTIHNLRCTPKTLILLEIIKEENGGCSSIKEEMYQCKKCQTKWLITEEFDTHHGYAKSAKKI